jgi:cytoskeletal protein CcmA (bactofilin family)
VGAATDDPFCGAESLVVLEGETRRGDTYFMSRNIDVSGTFEGDLIGAGQAAIINGVVTGDLAMAGSTMDIRGQVMDSVRFFGQSLSITGSVDGDVLFFGGQLNIHPQARITGNVLAYGGSAFIEGDVGGGVTFGGGQASISGPVAGSASITADTVRVAPTARIQGDFEYTTRKEIEFPDGVVDGEILFKEQVDDDDGDDESPFFTLGGFFKWGWLTLAGLLVGMVAIALLRQVTPALVAPISREGMLVTLVGLGIFLVVPAASILAIVLVISLPLGVIALVLFFIGLYLAKLPVAIWLGQRLLGLCGVSAPSPFLALAAGLLPLYVMFEIPFFIGTLVYLVTVWLGLGAFVLGARGYLQERVSANT